jgi:hypothetical protein
MSLEREVRVTLRDETPTGMFVLYHETKTNRSGTFQKLTIVERFPDLEMKTILHFDTEQEAGSIERAEELAKAIVDLIERSKKE